MTNLSLRYNVKFMNDVARDQYIVYVRSQTFRIHKANTEYLFSADPTDYFGPTYTVTEIPSNKAGYGPMSWQNFNDPNYRKHATYKALADLTKMIRMELGDHPEITGIDWILDKSESF